MAEIFLITGGARSGKSAFSELLAKKIGQDDVVYVATLSNSDDEMQKRIARHRRLRPATWQTIEITTDFVFKDISENVVLVDCL